jgi:prepilin-type N-terminal cleavage/methylation domain-containing protein
MVVIKPKSAALFYGSLAKQEESMQKIRSGIRDQRGFTLIEIIMVIVLLGIIAAIAIPKYIDLRTEASDATASGIVGAIVSSASIGYADLVTHNSGTTFPNFTTLHNNYLQAQNITMNSDANGWWANIGGNTYTFTYNAGTGNSGWDKP